jgi:hypothetical protein
MPDPRPPPPHPTPPTSRPAAPRAALPALPGAFTAGLVFRPYFALDVTALCPSLQPPLPPGGSGVPPSLRLVMYPGPNVEDDAESAVGLPLKEQFMYLIRLALKSCE